MELQLHLNNTSVASNVWVSASRGRMEGPSRISRPHVLSGLIFLVGSQRCHAALLSNWLGEGPDPHHFNRAAGRGRVRGYLPLGAGRAGRRPSADAAHGCGQCTHNGGQDVEGTLKRSSCGKRCRGRQHCLGNAGGRTLSTAVEVQDKDGHLFCGTLFFFHQNWSFINTFVYSPTWLIKLDTK